MSKNINYINHEKAKIYILNEFLVTARRQSIEFQECISFVFEVAARQPGCEADERRHTMRARARSQQRGGL
ncbi:hypothetical protein [Candidatus Regiella insecticola]|uniref:hypothetical protein n=1 Tax=Candidatus Regiella insecticola TaxID=138073 RepID=UPI0002E86D6D|nr:hypothetical protein [Candidatus Regiella insecticola]